MSDAISIAGAGLQAAFARFNGAAASLAGNPQDPIPAIATVMETRLEVRADLAVMRTAQRMQQSLLDILV
jgi:hypothetical protein